MMRPARVVTVDHITTQRDSENAMTCDSTNERQHCRIYERQHLRVLHAAMRAAAALRWATVEQGNFTCAAGRLEALSGCGLVAGWLAIRVVEFRPTPAAKR